MRIPFRSALSALNLYGYFSDQRAKAIAENWHTIDAYSDKPYDGGRKTAVENLLSYGQVLYNANFNRAPFIYLNAKPACQILGLPLGSFGWLRSIQPIATYPRPTNCIRAELQDSEFRGAKLFGSDFTHANLYQADFSPFVTKEGKQVKSQVQYVNFSYSDLRGSKFRAADLSNSNLYMADLRGADMREVNIKGAKLCMTKVSVMTLGLDELTSIPSSCKDNAIQMEP